jgi:hypothetical protein
MRIAGGFLVEGASRGKPRRGAHVNFVTVAAASYLASILAAGAILGQVSTATIHTPQLPQSSAAATCAPAAAKPVTDRLFARAG